jgi:peptidyl-prolyl cis-trans isomerase A (cyclophilin A)
MPLPTTRRARATTRAAATRTAVAPTAADPARAAAAVAAERLEPRRLFAAVVAAPMAGTVGVAGGAATTVDLAPHFDDAANTYVKFSTPLGDYRVRLFDAQKPATVQNFLKYVTQGRYNNTIIHRVDTLAAGGTAAPITDEPEIVQGGGYVYPRFEHIKTDAPVANEFATNGAIGNTRGTVAMAKTSDPDSATSEWFVNTADNRAVLDDPANSGGFTVFGEVLPEDMAIVDAIGDVPRYPFGGAFGKIPLRNYTAADFAAQLPPVDTHVIPVTAAVIPDLMTYSATSDDPSLVTPTVDGNGKLSLSYGAGRRGTANITVTATPMAGGPAAVTTFAAGVGQLDVQVGGESGNTSLSFREDDGTVGTLSIKGRAPATVRLAGNDLTQATTRGRLAVGGTGVSLVLVTLTGTTAATTVTLSGKGGDRVLPLGSLSADAPVKAIVARGVSLTGSITTSGAVGALTLGNATGATINLGGDAAAAGSAITVGTMTDTDLLSGGPVRSLKVAGTANTDAEQDVISVNGNLDSLSVAGDLASDVIVNVGGNIRSAKVGGSLTGDVTAHQIFSMSVRRDMTGSTISTTHEANEHGSAAEANRKPNLGIGSLKVSGSITDSVVRSAGSIGSVSAAGLTGSRVFAGPAAASVALLPASRPTSARRRR